MIQLVLFDVGNVVVRATDAITHAILEELGVLAERARRFYTITAYAAFSRGKISGEQFAQAMRAACEALWLTDEQIRTAHDAHIYIVDRAVEELLDELELAEVPLKFVTTTNMWQTARERQLINLAARFGDVVRSHEVGMTKTDEGAWPVILKALRLHDQDPATILLVDDAAVNCEAARRAGLQMHQYDPTPVVGVQKLREDLRQRSLLG